MDRGDYFITIMSIILVILCIFLIYCVATNPEIMIKTGCEAYGTREMECCYNCQELGKEYYKFKSVNWGPDECWCREGNNTVRIW